MHGSPRKVNEYLFEDKPAEPVRAAGRPGADRDVLVFGHTHKPWVHEYGGVLFVNCGSVGKPKDGDPRGAFAILEASERPASEARIERVDYDAERVAREVADAGPAERVRRQAAARGLSSANRLDDLDATARRDACLPSSSARRSSPRL